jgi:hypothetical protein
MTPWILALLIAAMIILHQDTWNWRTAEPVVFGFLPIGIAYHAAYTLAAALLMALLVHFAWPSEIERDAEEHARKGDQE